MSFINVFENLLKYNDKTFFIVLDINNNIWFKLSDILNILGYYNIRKNKRIKYIDDKNKSKFKYRQH